MNLTGARQYRERLTKMKKNVEEYYATNSKAKTIKYIGKQYGYGISASARFFRENIGEV
jgi:hypothetical protein